MSTTLNQRLSMPNSPEGEQEAARRLTGLFARHFDFVGRVARNLGVGSGDIDDVVQKVFAVSLSRLSDIPADQERAFLAQTAVKVAANQRRSLARHKNVSLDLAVAIPDESASPEALTEQRQALERLDAILGRLDDDTRSVFVLYEIEEFTMKEIGEALAIPQGTVASRLRRGREAFEAALRAQGDCRHE